MLSDGIQGQVCKISIGAIRIGNVSNEGKKREIEYIIIFFLWIECALYLADACTCNAFSHVTVFK